MGSCRDRGADGSEQRSAQAAQPTRTEHDLVCATGAVQQHLRCRAFDEERFDPQVWPGVVQVVFGPLQAGLGGAPQVVTDTSPANVHGTSIVVGPAARTTRRSRPRARASRAAQSSSGTVSGASPRPSRTAS
jgi:hypothetical protein